MKWRGLFWDWSNICLQFSVPILSLHYSDDVMEVLIFNCEARKPSPRTCCRLRRYWGVGCSLNLNNVLCFSSTIGVRHFPMFDVSPSFSAVPFDCCLGFVGLSILSFLSILFLSVAKVSLLGFCLVMTFIWLRENLNWIELLLIKESFENEIECVEVSKKWIWLKQNALCLLRVFWALLMTSSDWNVLILAVLRSYWPKIYSVETHFLVWI